MRSKALLLVLVVMAICWRISLQQQQGLVFISHNGVLTSRVLCREVIQCVGSGTSVFWSFFGLGVAPLVNSDSRFQNSSTIVVNGSNIITTNLTFDPLLPEHASIYVCQVVGSVSSSRNIRVVVEQAPVAVISSIPNVDLSTHLAGSSITVTCQVETCVSDLTVTFYKGSDIIETTSVTIGDNVRRPLAFSLSLVADAGIVGEYGCRALTPEGGSELVLFSIFGNPIPVSSTGSSSSTSTSSRSSTSTTSSQSTVSPTGMVGATVTVDTPSPTVSISPSPGGATSLSTFISLLLVTIAALIMI